LVAQIFFRKGTRDGLLGAGFGSGGIGWVNTEERGYLADLDTLVNKPGGLREKKETGSIEMID